jgi:hypothetical protein
MQVCTRLMSAAGLGIASAQELVDLVKDRVPGAAIDFQVDGNRQKIIDGFTKPLDDSLAQKEWG